MKYLENWRYMIEFRGGCNQDRWRLTGECEGRDIMTSAPAFFDEQEMVVRTRSGSFYKLGNCAGNLEEQMKYIREDVQRVLQETNENRQA